jgi:hypothetical protein
MSFFFKAVVTGFGLSLGAALFKKVGKRVGLVDDDRPPSPTVTDPAAHDARDPNLQPSYS